MKKIEYIIAGIIVIGFVFMYTSYRNNTPNQAVSAIATSTVATTTATEITPFDFQGVQVDTSDWQTYRNEQYGYEFKYPKGWSKVIRNNEGLSTEQKIENQKYLVDSKNTLLANLRDKFGLPEIEVWLYKGKNYSKEKFGLVDLEAELRANSSEYSKVTKFKNGDNTIVTLSLYSKYGPTEFGVINNITLWLVTKKDEVFTIFAATREDGPYVPDDIKYITGVYRTFKNTD